MLSEKRKEELRNAVIEAKDTEEYLIKQEQALGRGSIDQSWHILLTYLSTEDLVKHSKSLTRWTRVIAIFTIVLGLSTIWAIIDKFFL
ncbi:hypothetical protein ACFLTR_03060 [Chloroflexota bacterium]